MTMATTAEVAAERFAADTQKAIATLEAGLTKMREEEAPEWFAMLSQGVVKELEAMRREIAERFLPTHEELTQAHENFLEYEPRDLFYRVACWLSSQTENRTAPLTTAEAIATLLFIWNAIYYHNHPQERHKGLEGLERLLCQHGQKLQEFRHRTIETLTEEDGGAVREVFAAFCEVLKPVGAAKALHLLSPNFFPLWDNENEIAKAYGLPRRPKATPQDDAQSYWQFMQVVKWQCRLLRERSDLPDFARRNLLKALDEWNYVKFAKGWI